MRIVKKTILIITLILVVVGSADAAKTERMTAKEKRAKTLELVDKYAQALDSTLSFIEHYERTGEYRGRFPANHPYYSMYGSKKFRYKMFDRGMFKFKENNGWYHQEYAWGYFNEEFKNLPEDTPMYRLWITAKDFGYFHQINKGRAQLGSATWRKKTRETATIGPPKATVGIAHLLGYIDSDERLDEVLRKATRISVRDETETIRGSECFVIVADTKYGLYAVWLDPKHGFHPAKVRRKAKEGDYTHHHLLRKGWTATGYLDVLKFEQVDDIWVPVEVNAGFHRTIGSPAYYMDEDKHYKRTQIILNPDHDKLGSFANPILEDPNNDPELKNGTRVRLNDRPTEYTFQNGKLVDKDGKVVMDCLKKPNVQVAGKTIREKEINQRKYQYLLFLPEGYGERQVKWPLILFLHGAGERGDDLEAVKKHGLAKIVEADKKFPFVVVSPQCPRDQWWSNDKLMTLLDEIVAQYNVDNKRIYLTGLSMGGNGTWNLACAFPDRFAAVAPICGWGDSERACNIKNVPIWAFHGAKDKAVPISRAQEMVNAVKACGGNVKFTIYPDTDHDSWTVTYENNELYDWFLKHR